MTIKSSYQIITKIFELLLHLCMFGGTKVFVVCFLNIFML